MNIGVFTIMLHSGGTERVITRLSCLWAKMGHEIHFMTLRHAQENEFMHQCVSRDCANGEHWTPREVGMLHEKYHFDVVVFNGGWNNSWVDPLLLLFRQLGVKVLVVLHHSFNNWAFSNGNVADFDKDAALGNIDGIVCVDKLQAFWWSRRHPHVCFIQNPVTRFESSEGNATIRHSLVWVGRADDWGKRLELALKIFRAVRKKIPDATLTIVGKLKDGKPIVEKGVTCTGYLAEATEVIGRASLHLFTSLWEVTVPQVILEAGAVGVPTVAIDLPVLRGVKGCVLEKDCGALARKIVEIWESPESHKKLASEARSEVLSLADEVLISQKWGNLFDALNDDKVLEFCAQNSKEFRSLDVAERLIDEVQRSERFFVEKNLSLLGAVQLWKGRINRLKRIFVK